MNLSKPKLQRPSIVLIIFLTLLNFIKGDEIMNELEKIVESIPIQDFEGDATLVQYYSTSRGTTTYKQLVSVEKDSFLVIDTYFRTSNDVGKTAIVLLPNMGPSSTAKSRRTYAAMRQVPASPKFYFVTYIYLREGTPSDPYRGQHQIGNSSYFVEFDTWDNRGQDKHAIGWTECSSSVFIPCRSKNSSEQNFEGLREVIQEAKKQKLIVREEKSKLMDEGSTFPKHPKMNDLDLHPVVDYYEDFEYDIVHGVYGGNQRIIPRKSDSSQLGRGLLGTLGLGGLGEGLSNTLSTLNTQQLTNALGLTLNQPILALQNAPKIPPPVPVNVNNPSSETFSKQSPPVISGNTYKFAKDDKPQSNIPRKSAGPGPDIKGIPNLFAGRFGGLATQDANLETVLTENDIGIVNSTLENLRKEEKENIKAEMAQETAGGGGGLVHYDMEDYTDGKTTSAPAPQFDDYEADPGKASYFSKKQDSPKVVAQKPIADKFKSSAAKTKIRELARKVEEELANGTQTVTSRRRRSDTVVVSDTEEARNLQYILDDVDVYALPGWVAVEPIKSVRDLPHIQDDAFIGFGACPYRQITANDFTNSKTQDEILHIYLGMLRTGCIKEEIQFFSEIFKSGCLTTHSGKIIRISDQCSILGRDKLKKTELLQLSRSVELSALSEAIQSKLSSLELRSETTPDVAPICNGVDVVGRFVFRVLKIARSTPFHIHFVRIHRNTLKSLEIIYEKLLTDSSMLAGCTKCVKAQNVNRNDRAYIKGLILFILREGRPFSVGGSAEATFKKFFLANKLNIDNKVDIHAV